MERPANTFPLFKGATRTALFMGVPLFPLIIAVFVVFIPAMLLSLFWWLALAPIYFTMRLIVKHDDKAFGIWSLYMDTSLRNKNKGFWKASSYAPVTYHTRNRHGRR